LVGQSLFVAGIAITAGLISSSYGLVPAVGSVPAAAASWIFGGIAGGAIGAIVWFLWRRLSWRLTEEGAEERILNVLVLGVGASWVGGVFYFALAAAFRAGVGVDIAKGALLVGCTLLGARVGYSLRVPVWRVGKSELPAAQRNRRRSQPQIKILDTSVIIDGRVGDLLATGFVEGEILVPEFILSELQNIADSSNSLRRRKGRRGLNVLHQLMEDDAVDIHVVSRDYPAITEVDRKLIRLAKDEAAALITTDYNLNRVAQVEGVDILNVNELANAVKPRFIPGEEISIEVIDRGEAINQGVGYLDDGTMVVVENGRRHIGRTIKATVKSTLQTEAGRMLFVEPAGESPRWAR
jgi:rRNA-processing protein FCF1